MEASTGLSITLSEILIGLSIKTAGFLYSFLFIQITLVTALFITIVFLKDVVKNKQNSQTHTSILSYAKASYDIYAKPSENGRRWRLNLGLIILLMGAYVNTGRTDICTFFLKDFPFCWKSDYIGYFMGGLLLLTYTGSLILNKLIGRKVGDKGLILIGCLSGIISNFFMGFANSLSFLIVSLITGSFTALTISMVRSINSKLVTVNEQGAMFAGIACVETVASLVGLIGNDAVYMATIDLFKPSAFIVCAGILSIGFVTMSGYMWHEGKLNRLRPQPLLEEFY